MSVFPTDTREAALLTPSDWCRFQTGTLRRSLAKKKKGSMHRLESSRCIEHIHPPHCLQISNPQHQQINKHHKEITDYKLPNQPTSITDITQQTLKEQ
jgi:hypothetical protein